MLFGLSCVQFAVYNLAALGTFEAYLPDPIVAPPASGWRGLILVAAQFLGTRKLAGLQISFCMRNAARRKIDTNAAFAPAA